MSTEQPQGGEHKKPPIPTPAKRVPAYNIERRGDRLYQVQTLHKWFAISSLALFVFTVAMVMQDYLREWKGYQREFSQLSITNAREDARAALNSIDRNAYNQLAAELKAATASEDQNKDRINELTEQAAALNARFIRVDQNYKFEKAKFDEARYNYEEALAEYERAVAEKKPADKLKAHADELKAAADATSKRTDEYFLDREQVNTDLQAANAELSKLKEKSTEDRRKLVALRAEFDRLRRQLNTLNLGALVTTVINAPLMDFMKPSLQIKQILLPNLFYDQPFKQISRADRCTTCHLGIDQPRFEQQAHPFKSHPDLDLFLGSNSPHPMEKFGCTSCHGGLDRATDFVTAGHTPQDEKQKDDWEFKYGWKVDHYLETPMSSLANVESGCYKCHNGSPEVPRAPTLDNGRDLIRIYGCFGCHKLPGYDGIRKVGPDLTTISGKLTKEWTRKWLADPKQFKSEARMPRFWNNTNNSGVSNGVDWDKRNAAEINAVVEFLYSESTAKTLPTANTNGNAARGKELVESVGCFGCHAVGSIEDVPNRTQTRRRHGYNLASQGSKVTANWIANWVKDPRAVWAESKMPSLRLSDSEVGDITAYLTSLRNADWENRTAPQTDTAALDAVVFEFLRAGTTEVKARAELAAMSLEQKNLYAGKQLVGRYGCYACHNIRGFETAQPIGTELTEAGSKLISQLDFGFLDIEHTRADWYSQKLKNPRIFDQGRIKRPEELLRMPNFQMSDKDVNSIVMALTSMVKDPVPLEMKERTEPAVSEGRQLVAEKNCKGCHIVESMGGDIRASIKDQVQWPPNLNTQGQKTQPDWLHAFLKDPGANKPRPWLSTRMPTFHFTEHEAFAIGRYFSALDKVDNAYISTEIESTPEQLRAGAVLFEKLECMKCHPAGSGGPSGGDAGAVAPNLLLSHNRLRPEWVPRWLLDPQTIAPNTRMPTFFSLDPKTGKRTTQAPDILKGDVNAQIRAIRDHLFTLGGGQVKVSGN